MITMHLVRLFGRRVGFMLLVFEYGDGGGRQNMAYITSAMREDMIALVKEFLSYQEAGLSTDPQGPMGRA